MSDMLLQASQRTLQMIGRGNDLRKIWAALLQPPHRGLIVQIVKGWGGVGKSRLAEEILLQAGNHRMEEMHLRGEIEPAERPLWYQDNHLCVVAPDLLDMNDLRIHSPLEFMNFLAVRLEKETQTLDRLDLKPIDFGPFHSQYINVRKAHLLETNYQAAKEAIEKAQKAFFDTYRQAAQEQRIVLIIDTCEKLGYAHTDWLIDEWRVIEEEDIQFSTAYWLTTQIKRGMLPNTLLLLIGRRDDAGKQFYNRVRNAAMQVQTAEVPCSLNEDIELERFTLQETISYLEKLRRDFDFLAIEKNNRESFQYSRFRDRMDILLNDSGKLRSLQAYTGGLPVNLALYGALLTHGKEMPEHLNDNPDVAEENAKDKETLKSIQREMGESFINLLFESVGLRAGIFNLLIAAPRGLDENQLYLCINGKRDLSTEDESQLRKDIHEEVKKLKWLSIIKNRPDGRIALQDAIYETFSENQVRTVELQEEEIKVRSRYYWLLYDYASEKLEIYERQRREYREREEQKLQRKVRETYEKVVLKDEAGSDLENRLNIAEKIRFWEMEKLHYSLLVNLVVTLNDVVFELAHRDYKANNEESDFRSLEEVYQVLNNEPLMAFLKIEKWTTLEIRKEPSAKALKRFMRQAEVTRWIQRFILRKNYDRAKTVIEAVEGKGGIIDQLPDPDEKRAWKHTLSEGERNIWWAYLQTFLGNHQQAIEILNQHIPRIERLLREPQSVVVNPGKGERGFADHPARRRMIRLIALAYNYLGYAYVQHGSINDGIKSYAMSLKMLRKMEFPSLTAVTLNNLSRALSDKGRGRAWRVCLDGLSMQKQFGADVTVANSYNTLALIANDQNRPNDARIAAAVAVAYYERARDERGLGLSYLQFGEALRRIASMSERTDALVGYDPKDIFDESERVLQEAVNIFSKGPVSGEVLRRVEALIEFGCLLRDRILQPNRLNDQQKIMFGDELEELEEQNQKFYDKAIFNLRKAVLLSRENGFKRLELDALINLAWTHNNMYKYQEAERALNEAKEIIPSNVIIKPRKRLPDADAFEAYYFQQLSKMEGLRGRMWMEHFIELRNEWQANEGNSQSEDIQELKDSREFARRDQKYKKFLCNELIQKPLREAIEAYTRALLYGELYSPRSGSITLIYDALYSYLKGFNPREIMWAYDFSLSAAKCYRTQKITRYSDQPEYLTAIEEMINEEAKTYPHEISVLLSTEISVLSDLPQFIRECIGEFTKADFEDDMIGSCEE